MALWISISSSRLVGLLTGCLLVLLTSGSGAEEAEKKTGWTGDVNLSLSNQTGTNDVLLAEGEINLARDWEKDKLAAQFVGAYGETRDREKDPATKSKTKTNQNRQRLQLTHRRDLMERFFWKSATEGARDSVNDINFIYRIGSGPGYRFWQAEESADEFLDLFLTPGYRFVTFRDSTDEDTQNLADIVAGFEYKNSVFEGRLDIGHTGEFFFPVNDTQAWIARTGIVFGVPITAAWSMRTSFNVLYQNTTPARVNKLTTQLSAGISYKF
jgi:hypothetical protein